MDEKYLGGLICVWTLFQSELLKLLSVQRLVRTQRLVNQHHCNLQAPWSETSAFKILSDNMNSLWGVWKSIKKDSYKNRPTPNMTISFLEVAARAWEEREERNCRIDIACVIWKSTEPWRQCIISLQVRKTLGLWWFKSTRQLIVWVQFFFNLTKNKKTNNSLISLPLPIPHLWQPPICSLQIF